MQIQKMVARVLSFTQQVWKWALQSWRCAWRCLCLLGHTQQEGSAFVTMVVRAPSRLMSKFQVGLGGKRSKSEGLSLFVQEGSASPATCADISWGRTMPVALLAARESKKSGF